MTSPRKARIEKETMFQIGEPLEALERGEKKEAGEEDGFISHILNMCGFEPLNDAKWSNRLEKNVKERELEIDREEARGMPQDPLNIFGLNVYNSQIQYPFKYQS